MIGLPCNQFGAEEPGTPEEIATFCSTNYSVSFPLTEKIEVNGDNRHPVYQRAHADSRRRRPHRRHPLELREVPHRARRRGRRAVLTDRRARRRPRSPGRSRRHWPAELTLRAASHAGRARHIRQVVVDDAARLHRGVDRRRADEAEPEREQRLRARLRLRRRRRDVGERARRRRRRRRFERPEQRGQRPVLALRRQCRRARSRSSPRSCRGGARCPRHPSSRSTSRVAEARDRSRRRSLRTPRGSSRACAGSSARTGPTGSLRDTASRRGAMSSTTGRPHSSSWYAA